MVLRKAYCIHLALLACFCTAALAQQSPQMNAAEIRQGLEKLNVLGSVLYFAAHPDDENTRLIGWLAKEKLYRTAYLSLTRGDGGQNLIGTEQGEELGLIRTQELLAARRTDGGEQFFSRANDFGFSKTAEETLTIWDKEKVLADAVWVIRQFRPDIIITRFPGDPRAGHGHHQASSLIAQEAFVAAADATRFPEQLAYVAPWQAKRILWNTFNFGSANTISEGQLMIDIGQYNALLGTSYGELAALSRNWHKSQGFGSTVVRGTLSEYFELLGGEAAGTELMEGVNTSWQRVPGGEQIAHKVSRLINDYDGMAPTNTVDGLLRLLSDLEGMPQGYWAIQKAVEVKELLLACAGLWFECYAPEAKVALGEELRLRTDFVQQKPGVDIEVLGIAGEKQGIGLAYNQPLQVEHLYAASKLTQPYWLDRPHDLGTFWVDDQQDIGLPESASLPKVPIDLKINGRVVRYERPVVYKSTDPVRGEVYRDLVISPVISANAEQRAMVFVGSAGKEVRLSIKGHKDEVRGELKPVLPKGWRSMPDKLEINLLEADDEASVSFMLYPPDSGGLGDSLAFRFNGDTLRAYRAIRYDHIPALAWFPETKIRLSQVKATHSAQKIGYLMGAGDLVPQALREVGLNVELLSENDVLTRDLSHYDAIVTGIRLYNTSERMRYMQPRLMAYVEAGGTLVEQYNVNNGLKIAQLGPYAFRLSRNRVTEEDAEVKFGFPTSDALNYPNTITATDFDGWVQERGLYFAEEADPRYEQPLVMHDKGEEPLSGSLLIAPYGKGKYVYTSLSFFRQLPAGVPGAYRLFVNLLAKKNED